MNCDRIGIHSKRLKSERPSRKTNRVKLKPRHEHDGDKNESHKVYLVHKHTQRVPSVNAHVLEPLQLLFSLSLGIRVGLTLPHPRQGSRDTAHACHGTHFRTRAARHMRGHLKASAFESRFTFFVISAFSHPPTSKQLLAVARCVYVCVFSSHLTRGLSLHDSCETCSESRRPNVAQHHDTGLH